jgi:hypothetical protein
MRKAGTIEIECNISFKVSFWQALKIRLAGKGAEKLIMALAKSIAEDNNEINR